MNERKRCSLRQESKGNWILKTLRLKQSSKDSCWELAGAWMVNIHLSIRSSFLLHQSTFMLCHHCNAQQNPVRSKPQREQQRRPPAWEKAPYRLWVMGGWRRHSSSETWYPAKLGWRAERHQALI